MDAAQPFFVWLVNYYGLDFYINYSLERVSFEFFYYMNYWKDRRFLSLNSASLQLCDLKEVTYLLRPQLHHLSNGYIRV